MKFLQIFTLAVMVVAALGVIGEGGKGKWVYVGLFSSAGLLYLAAWTLGMTIC